MCDYTKRRLPRNLNAEKRGFPQFTRSSLKDSTLGLNFRSTVNLIVFGVIVVIPRRASGFGVQVQLVHESHATLALLAREKRKP